MTLSPHPVLYSFRRCPYAMRGRMGLYVSGIVCELREVVLREKPSAMLTLSPKGTVPVLQTAEGEVIDESLEVMLWALGQHDPESWLRPEQGNMEMMLALIERNDGEFKGHLDRYKYPTRYGNVDPLVERTQAEGFLQALEQHLSLTPYLFGSRASLVDFAIAPFIRQFAHVDKVWFDQTPYPCLQSWLEDFLQSDLFGSIMKKYSQWQEGDTPVMFG